jgi:ribosome-associated protein
MILVTDDITLADRDVKERFVRASGAGGQNLRKEATAVELRLNIDASPLPPDVKDRLRALAGRHVTGDGVLVVVSRADRSQAKNRDAARARLVALVRAAARQPKKRRPTRPRAGEREKRLASKRWRSAVKQGRSRRGDRQ